MTPRIATRLLLAGVSGSICCINNRDSIALKYILYVGKINVNSDSYPGSVFSVGVYIVLLQRVSFQPILFKQYCSILCSRLLVSIVDMLMNMGCYNVHVYLCSEWHYTDKPCQ